MTLEPAFVIAGLLAPISSGECHSSWTPPDWIAANPHDEVSEIGALGVQYGVTGRVTFVLQGVPIGAFGVGLSRELRR